MKDLIKGDKVRRVNSNFQNIKIGEVYTFKKYEEGFVIPCIFIDEYPLHSLEASNFEKVETGLEDLGKETLLEKANRLYPKGTVFMTLSTIPNIQTVSELEETATSICDSSSFYMVYDKRENKWAEIVTKTSPCVHQSPEYSYLNDLPCVEDRREGATKHDSGKPSFSAIPQLALLEVAKGFTHGKIKYGKFNYSGAVEATRLTDALQRHLNQYLSFRDKNDIDESGVHHLANVACNAMMLLDAILNNTVIDDRNQAYKK